MKQQTFFGVATAIVTPFSEDGKNVDFEALKNLIDEQINAGVGAIVVLGTTGEAATLSQDECDEILSFVVKHINKRAFVIAGAGSNNTLVAIQKSKRYEELGVDGLLHVTPFYNKATQSGLFEHFSKIAASTTLPIILYNVPSRTGVNLLPQTILSLSQTNNIVGIKEASGNICQIAEILRICPKDFAIFSGDDALTFSTLALGGAGVISVASNVVPQKMTALCSSFFEGDIKKAREIQLELLPLINALFLEVNPIPVKAALSLLGKTHETLRLPLTPMSKENKQKLVHVLQEIKILQ